MSPAQLLARFDRIGEAPNAVPRLRRFILDLAVRGKLVEQDPADEPAFELLRRINAEKKRQVTDGRLKKQEALREVRPDEAWFAIPLGWSWVRLGTITHVLMGQSPPGETYNKTGEGIPLINGPVEFTEGPFGKTVINQYTTAPTNLCEEDDLLICVRGSTTGRTNIAGFRACIGRGVAAIRPVFPDHYVRLLIWRLRASIIAMGRGIAFPSVSRQQIEELPVPLPPLAEQHRIVAKVGDLMALCDRLEAAQAEREARRDRLVEASLHRLSHPAEESDFREQARFYLGHLPHLTTRPEHVQQLRQTILSLAVRGQLVPQDPNDEPASELLQRIKAEKARLVRDEKIRKQEPSPPIQNEGLPFRVPAGWWWSRLAIISRKIHYGFTASANPSIKDVRLLRITDIQNNSVDWSSVPGCDISEREVDQYGLDQGDILIARTGGTIGKSFLVKQIPVVAVFASYLIRIQGSKELYGQYLKLFLESPTYWQQLQEGARGGGQPNVNGRTLGLMLVPVPPIGEQHRIVAKVKELLTLCARLETQLTTAQTESRRLIESVLHQALNGGRY